MAQKEAQGSSIGDPSSAPEMFRRSIPSAYRTKRRAGTAQEV
ncbi:hypothetical protein DsansV1_C15g0134391 [Dioscorea sansibarensis]